MSATTASPPSVTVARVFDQGNAGPCGERNRLLREAETDWVFLLDEDAVPGPGCLELLLASAQAHPEADVIVPRVMRAETTVHYDGGSAHFLGDTCFDNFHRPLSEAGAPRPWPGAAATTALLVRRAPALSWGGFDEDLVFFREDLEFCLRARLLGARLRSCPEALVRHEPGPRGPLHARRAFYQTRNRLRLLLTLCSARTLALTFPLQAAYELAGFVSAGSPLQSLAAWTDVARSLPALLLARRALQARRRVSDRELLGAPPLTWRPEIMCRPGASVVLRLLNAASALWWRAVVARG